MKNRTLLLGIYVFSVIFCYGVEEISDSPPLNPSSITNETPSNFMEIVAEQGFTGVDALPEADPEGRGVENGIAYAIGLPLAGEITIGQRSRLPALVQGNTPNTAALGLTLPTIIPNDVTICIKQTDDLTVPAEEWVEIARKEGNSDWTGLANVILEQNENEVRVIIEDLESREERPKSFLRMDVFISPPEGSGVDGITSLVGADLDVGGVFSADLGDGVIDFTLTSVDDSSEVVTGTGNLAITFINTTRANGLEFTFDPDSDLLTIIDERSTDAEVENEFNNLVYNNAAVLAEIEVFEAADQSDDALFDLIDVINDNTDVFLLGGIEDNEETGEASSFAIFREIQITPTSFSATGDDIGDPSGYYGFIILEPIEIFDPEDAIVTYTAP